MVFHQTRANVPKRGPQRAIPPGGPPGHRSHRVQHLGRLRRRQRARRGAGPTSNGPLVRRRRAPATNSPRVVDLRLFVFSLSLQPPCPRCVQHAAVSDAAPRGSPGRRTRVLALCSSRIARARRTHPPLPTAPVRRPLRTQFGQVLLSKLCDEFLLCCIADDNMQPGLLKLKVGSNRPRPPPAAAAGHARARTHRGKTPIVVVPPCSAVVRRHVGGGRGGAHRLPPSIVRL